MTPTHLTPAPSFTIFPAIDLRDGKVVRLAQGDPNRQTTYGDDPHAWAERWQQEGAAWLHIINLSGAFNENSVANLKALEKILETGLKVEFGGGLRDEAGIRAVLGMGVERVFLGTAAIRNPGLIGKAVEEFGAARIAGDIGARGGRVSIQGWQEPTIYSVQEIGRRFRDHGLKWCVLTDVARDGISNGVNISSALELQNDSELRVVASGGVASLADVQAARAAGLAGVIIGRARYEGKISLKECFTGAA